MIGFFIVGKVLETANKGLFCQLIPFSPVKPSKLLPPMTRHEAGATSLSLFPFFPFFSTARRW